MSSRDFSTYEASVVQAVLRCGGLTSAREALAFMRKPGRSDRGRAHIEVRHGKVLLRDPVKFNDEISAVKREWLESIRS